MSLTEWDEASRDINVKQNEVPVVTLFTMPACASCKRMEAVLADLAHEYGGEVAIGKCLAGEYRGDVPISSVPRVFITTSGKVFGEYGVISADKLRTEIDDAIMQMETAE